MTHHNEQGDTIMGDEAGARVLVAGDSSLVGLERETSPSPTQLNEAVKLIAEMDAKRTQGDWVWEDGTSAFEGALAKLWAGKEIVCHFGDNTAYDNACGEEPQAIDKAFIAAAPLMAATVAQLWDELERLDSNLKCYKTLYESVNQRTEQQAAVIEQLQQEVSSWKLDSNVWQSASNARDKIIEQQRAVLVQAREEIEKAPWIHASQFEEQCSTLTAIDNLLISQHENNCKDAKHPQVLGVHND